MAADSNLSTRLSLLFKVRDPTNAAAWGEFVAKYGQAIVQWCKSRGLQEADADDVSQGILCKLVLKMQTFAYDESGSFRKWLYTITRHAVGDYWDKQRRIPALGTGDTTANQLLQNVAESTDRLVEQLTREIEEGLFREAEQAVQAKVGEQTWAAYLARKRGEAAREVAQRLGMQVAAVHKAKSRVAQMIKKELRDIVGCSG